MSTSSADGLHSVAQAPTGHSQVFENQSARDIPHPPHTPLPLAPASSLVSGGEQQKGLAWYQPIKNFFTYICRFFIWICARLCCHYKDENTNNETAHSAPTPSPASIGADQQSPASVPTQGGDSIVVPMPTLEPVNVSASAQKNDQAPAPTPTPVPEPVAASVPAKEDDPIPKPTPVPLPVTVPIASHSLSTEYVFPKKYQIGQLEQAFDACRQELLMGGLGNRVREPIEYDCFFQLAWRTTNGVGRTAFYHQNLGSDPTALEAWWVVLRAEMQEEGMIKSGSGNTNPSQAQEVGEFTIQTMLVAKNRTDRLEEEGAFSVRQSYASTNQSDNRYRPRADSMNLGMLSSLFATKWPGQVSVGIRDSVYTITPDVPVRGRQQHAAEAVSASASSASSALSRPSVSPKSTSLVTQRRFINVANNRGVSSLPQKYNQLSEALEACRKDLFGEDTYIEYPCTFLIEVSTGPDTSAFCSVVFSSRKELNQYVNSQEAWEKLLQQHGLDVSSMKTSPHFTLRSTLIKHNHFIRQRSGQGVYVVKQFDACGRTGMTIDSYVPLNDQHNSGSLKMFVQERWGLRNISFSTDRRRIEMTNKALSHARGVPEGDRTESPANEVFPQSYQAGELMVALNHARQALWTTLPAIQYPCTLLFALSWTDAAGRKDSTFYRATFFKQHEVEEWWLTKPMDYLQKAGIEQTASESGQFHLQVSVASKRAGYSEYDEGVWTVKQFDAVSGAASTSMSYEPYNEVHTGASFADLLSKRWRTQGVSYRNGQVQVQQEHRRINIQPPMRVGDVAKEAPRPRSTTSSSSASASAGASQSSSVASSTSSSAISAATPSSSSSGIGLPVRVNRVPPHSKLLAQTPRSSAASHSAAATSASSSVLSAAPLLPRAGSQHKTEPLSRPRRLTQIITSGAPNSGSTPPAAFSSNGVPLREPSTPRAGLPQPSAQAGDLLTARLAGQLEGRQRISGLPS